MKLDLNTYPFRLEQGYELGYGPAGYETMAKVISAFQEPQSDILFSYTNWDRDKDPHKGELMESAAHDFHYGIINDPATSSKVKEILLLHYAPERDPKVSQAVMDQLLAYFREVPLEEINEELLRKIGSAVYEKQGVYTLADQDAATQDFVNSRLVDTNSVWLLPYERPVYLENVLWYRVNTQEEMVQAFERTDWWFTCAIVDRSKQVEDYRYFLNYTEEHGEDHDGMVLYISTPDPRHFKDTVIPRLKELLAEQLEIVG
ncbi:hypothetical protein SAMN05216378_5504 [Paenibacillus catalpae]|uniref:Uncharacterized protein n=1 Tax=Paenibacillus catalpae TaxID=1045775 RepID=A0A1I2GUE2_9BACL|nr:hypothetical protein [Paenibacillus catalpae]SFF21554.1 hypothetical protein SAMN05216378_5504 [Paenibacillus catalpae]